MLILRNKGRTEEIVKLYDMALNMELSSCCHQGEQETSNLVEAMDVVHHQSHLKHNTKQKLECQRPILKRSSNKDEIPISKRKKDYRVLPMPATKHRMQRSHSCPPTLIFTDNDVVAEPSSRSEPLKLRRSVAFADVEVREYDVTIGDNPCVSYGTPLSLDWSYTEYLRSSVDDYEISRMFTRKGKIQHLKLNYYERKFRLIHGFGYTEEDITLGAKQILNTQRERFLSSCQPIEHVRDACESAQRKVKRLLIRRNQQHDNLMMLGQQEQQQCTNLLPDSLSAEQELVDSVLTFDEDDDSSSSDEEEQQQLDWGVNEEKEREALLRASICRFAAKQKVGARRVGRTDSQSLSVISEAA